MGYRNFNIFHSYHRGSWWDRDLYIAEAHRQVDDNCYQSLLVPSLPQDQKTISGSVDKLINNEDLPSTAKLLIKSQAKQPTFYLLPKIHKLNSPGRPIVSVCSCPSENISEYLDSLLLPIVQSLPTYVKDTTHALTIFEQINEAQNVQAQLLFTMDVVSLYTSISHADGLRALLFFLDRRPPEARYPSTTTRVRLAELVLTLNMFEFDGEIFHQISEVAMGTKMEPSYTCLFMGHLEYRIMESFTGALPEVYKRYIDDGFGASSRSESRSENTKQAFHTLSSSDYEGFALTTKIFSCNVAR